MKVHIFSDVRCPFCYVGKKKFEKALSIFPYKDQIEIEWHSFQLDPTLRTQPERDPYEFFSELKGLTLEQTRTMHGHAEEAGKEVGIDFNFQNQKVANSFRAHLLLQKAKLLGKADPLKEELFKAQFILGENIDDKHQLLSISQRAGLSIEEAQEALGSEEMAYHIKQDEQLSRSIGVRAVPFFVFNEKYGVSGAQSPELFLEVLEKAWKEYTPSSLETIEGPEGACSTDGECN